MNYKYEKMIITNLFFFFLFNIIFLYYGLSYIDNNLLKIVIGISSIITLIVALVTYFIIIRKKNK